MILRVAIVEARASGDDLAATKEALEETLRLIERCAARIPDPAMLSRYLDAVPENVRARELALAVLGSAERPSRSGSWRANHLAS